MALSDEIFEALKLHVSNNMPIRLLQLPGLKLVERGETIKHLLPKMSDITENWIAKKIADTKWDQIKFIASNSDRRKYVLAEGIKERAAYAILSHTWLLTEPELTYPNWIANTNMSGPGYAKMKSFTDVAYKDHGMTLAWLDTLCINKDSTSELDESIRSMYRWYLNSAICIVILADTTSLFQVPQDRWFTRGWTLQELLAPRRLKFYAKNWKPLVEGYNDKGMADKGPDWDDEDNDDYNDDPNIEPFAQLIEIATGITPDELRNFDPKSHLARRQIPTKMMWASRRITTREEDGAYCLMGVFGVSFSIAYGEGKERAFFRLLEAILSTSKDILAILDWAGKPVDSDVHATTLLPSGPECYQILSEDERLESFAWDNAKEHIPFSFAPKEPMTLTHLGLKVDLYCMPAMVDPHSLKEFDGTYTVGLWCLNFRKDPITIQVYPHNFKEFDTLATAAEGRFKEFMFGIWTFERDPVGTVYLPSEPCRAFLLESEAGLYRVMQQGVWKKVETVEPIRLTPDLPHPTVYPIYEQTRESDKIEYRSMRTFIL